MVSGTAGASGEGGVAADAAGALHDLNNALHAIGASLRRLEVKMSRGEQHDLPALIAAMQHQLLRASTLARGALAGPAATADGDAVLAVAPFLRGMEPQLKALLDEAIRLDFRAEAEAGTVACDAARLESAIRNLVLNAREAMNGDGSLTLQVRRVHLGSSSVPSGEGVMPGSFAEIVVGDTGCGMSAELLRRCSTPYVSTRKGRGGSGLGLFQVRAFARDAGGFLRLESREGQGTTASILLPCREAARS